PNQTTPTVDVTRAWCGLPTPPHAALARAPLVQRLVPLALQQGIHVQLDEYFVADDHAADFHVAVPAHRESVAADARLAHEANVSLCRCALSFRKVVVKA